MGPRGGFSYFVFEQLNENGQFPKLLRLGEEFPQELVIFLKDHSDLMWLHEVFLHQYSGASKTLHGLALSGDEMFSAAEKETELDLRKTVYTLPQRKRLLHLSKIAAIAGLPLCLASYNTLLLFFLIFQFQCSIQLLSERVRICVFDYVLWLCLHNFILVCMYRGKVYREEQREKKG